jgi:hypothetical protein
MKVSKSDLCSSCLAIRQRLNNGSLSETIGEMLECKGYQTPLGIVDLNHAMLFYLEQNGGCQSCISVFKRATQS